MACRKAADRALMAVASWRQEQEESLEERRRDFLKAQYEQWIHPPAENSSVKPPPPSMSMHDFDDRYCIQWLADGPEVPHHDSLRGGCSGGCGKFHPRLILDWNNEESHGVALLEQGAEALVPFQKYMQELCQQKKATPIFDEQTQGSSKMDDSKQQQQPPTKPLPTTYRLSGFLRAHLDMLDQQATSQTNMLNILRSHLYKVFHRRALEASMKSHEQWMQEKDLEQTKKRRKLAAESDPVERSELLARVLSICYNSGALLDHLNVVDIAFMRCANKLFRGYAQLLAKGKMKALRFSLCEMGKILLLNEAFDGQDNSVTTDSLNLPRLTDEGRPLFAMQAQGGEEVSSPNQQTTSTMKFIPHPDSDYQYRIQVNNFLLPDEIDRIDKFYVLRIRLMLHEIPKCSLEVARIWLNLRPYTAGQEVTLTAQQGTPLSATVRVITNEHLRGILTPGLVPSLSEFKFEVKLLHVTVSFGDILGIFVRQLLPIAKARLKEIQQSRPATRQEKDYVRALAKAARDAPGNGAETFRNMDGWTTAVGSDSRL